MAISVYVPGSSTGNTDWSISGFWANGVIPNAADAEVIIAATVDPQTGEDDLRLISIDAGASYQINALEVIGDSLGIDGSLTANSLTVRATGWVTTGGTGDVMVSFVNNGGRFSINDVFSDSGAFFNHGVFTPNGTPGLSSLQNAGVLEAQYFSATIKLAPGAFANFSGTTLTGGTYEVGLGASLNLDIGGVITTDAANIALTDPLYIPPIPPTHFSGPAIPSDLNTVDPLTGKLVLLQTSLTTIAPSGALWIDKGSYAAGGPLTVNGLLVLETGAAFTAKTLAVAPTGDLILSVAGSLSGGTIINDGAIIVDAGPVDVFVKIDAVISSSVSGSGRLIIGPENVGVYFEEERSTPAILEVAGAVSNNIVFADNTGTLALDAPASFTGKVEGFVQGDQIVLTKLNLSSVTGYSYSGDASGGTLIIQQAGSQIDIAFSGSHTQSEFSLLSEAGADSFGPFKSGVAITDNGATSFSYSVDQAVAAKTSGTLGSGALVVDSIAEISAKIDALQGLVASGNVGTIMVDRFDQGADYQAKTIGVTAAQYNNDAAAIADIVGGYTLAVTGVSVSSAPYLAIAAHVGSISVSDSAANIMAHLAALDSLAAIGRLFSITIDDSASQTISVTSAQYAADLPAFSLFSGNSVLSIDGSTANLTLDGVENFSTVLKLGGSASQYAAAAGGDGNHFTLTDSGTGRVSTDYLGDVAALQFSDFTDIVAAAPGTGGAVTTGNITELYGAVFGRQPDLPGLSFYRSYLTANPSTSLTVFAQWFLASPEYTNNPAHAYAQTAAGDAQFVGDIYTDLLHRVASSDEVSFYQKVITPFLQGFTPGTPAYAAAETQAHALVLTYISQSPEFLTDVQVTAQNPTSAQHWLVLI